MPKLTFDPAIHEENPELTKEDFAKMRPAREVLGDATVNALARRAGRPKSENPKAAVNIRLDARVIEHFKASGPGWQTRINDALLEVVEKAG